jgi:3-oxoadipate enol-lactonase
MSLADTGAVRISYERAGAGPPLLLIMGMSGTFAHWHPAFLERLRASFDTIVYDHRGVGESSPLEGELTTALLAGDAAGLLDALDVESAHVLGISMGGMVAQQLALAQPSRTRTLTLGCTYCGGPHSVLPDPAVLGRLGEAMASGDRARAVRTAWEANVSPAFAAIDAEWERFRAIGATRAVAVPVILAQLQACSLHDTSARLGELAMPTLVMHGTLDQMLPVGNGHDIHARVPGSRLEIFDQVGHLFFWEDPLRAARLVCEHAGVPADAAAERSATPSGSPADSDGPAAPTGSSADTAAPDEPAVPASAA